MLLLEGMGEVGDELLPDVVSYNTCIKACGQAGLVNEAMQVVLLLFHFFWNFIGGNLYEAVQNLVGVNP